MITTLFGYEIPNPDGCFGDYSLPKHICDDLDYGLIYIKGSTFARDLRWSKKEDMEKVVSIYNDCIGIAK